MPAGLRAVLLAMNTLLNDPDGDRRPSADVWSAADYVAHSIDVVQEVLTEIADAAGWPAPPAATDCTTAIAALDQLLESRTSQDLENVSLETSFATLTGTGNLLHALHDLEHHTLDIRRGYASFALARGEDLHTNAR